MTVNRRKKKSRQRATTTHGWGAMKKHRGSGNRGGKGNAGSGKRGDSKKPSFDTSKYGKHGFRKKNAKVDARTISLADLQTRLLRLVADKKAVKEGDYYMIDLLSLGFNKLLSQGAVTIKLKITVPFASRKAIDKVKAAGGDIVGLAEKKAKKQKNRGAKAVPDEETPADSAAPDDE